MKNGFNYQGEEIEVRGGSFGRAGVAVQAGVQNGNYSSYVVADSVHDDGWRVCSSSSPVNRIYADLGARGDQTEFHLQFTGADDNLGAVAAIPAQLLEQPWSTIYIWPQTPHLQVAFLEATANWKLFDTFSMQGIGYYRGFWQSHVDGQAATGSRVSRVDLSRASCASTTAKCRGSIGTNIFRRRIRKTSESSARSVCSPGAAPGSGPL
jgi:iron complex outermembrane recepter protein